MESLLLDSDTYNNVVDWQQFFENGKTLYDVGYNASWKPMFENIYKLKEFSKVNDILCKEAENDYIMYPKPEYVFNAFKVTSLDDLRVVILGQDPYFSEGQAMGLSFSIPVGCPITSSLSAVFNNLKKNQLIDQLPKHGNLEFWGFQGCLMLNTSLTVKDGSKNKNCHSMNWNVITDYMISYISRHCEHVVFVLWGGSALAKIALIDKKKHKFVVSSHPSGLSCNSRLGIYESFNNTNFGKEVNTKLASFGYDKILWQS